MIVKVASLLLGVIAISVFGRDAQAAGLDGYRWKYRPVLVFAPEASDARLQRQQRIISSASASLRERDIVVVTVVGGSVSHQFGPAPSGNAAALRARYGVSTGEFAAILVGKDGGVKLKSASPLSSDKLAGVIDAMPMRQDEMRRSR